MITKKELLDALNEECVVSFTLSDGYTYDVGIADYWLGGSEEGFMSDILGNVEYPTAEACVKDIYKFLAEDGRTIISINN